MSTETHPAVAAVLAVTPTWDGDVVTGTETERTTYGPGEHRDVCARSGKPLVPDEYEVPVFGDPEPIAARQAAAVLRWLARDFGLVLCATDANKLDDLADEIEGKPTTPAPPVRVCSLTGLPVGVGDRCDAHSRDAAPCPDDLRSVQR